MKLTVDFTCEHLNHGFFHTTKKVIGLKGADQIRYDLKLPNLSLSVIESEVRFQSQFRVIAEVSEDTARDFNLGFNEKCRIEIPVKGTLEQINEGVAYKTCTETDDDGKVTKAWTEAFVMECYFISNWIDRDCPDVLDLSTDCLNND